MHPEGSLRLLKAIKNLHVHDHPCLIYDSDAEWQAAVVPFLRVGWERGERCLIFAPEATAVCMLKGLAAAGIDVDDALKRGALTVPNLRLLYGREEPFCPEKALEFLRQSIADAKSSGFTGLRLIGEMFWTLEGTSGAEPLIEYEAKLNDFILQHDLPALCLYDRSRLAPRVILDAISTHPKMIFGNVVSKSYFYLPPDQFFHPKRPSIEVDHILRGITINGELITALEEREALLNAVVGNSPDFIYVKDLDGRYQMINPAGAAFLGRRVEEVIGRKDAELFAPEFAQKLFELDSEALACDQAVSAELTLTTAAGTGTFHITKGSYCDVKGKVVGSFGIARDITPRKQVEDALRASEEQFRTLCDFAPIGIFRADLAGNGTYLNPRCEEILGMTGAQARGMGWVTGVHPDDRDDILRLWQEAADSGGVYSHECRILTAGGETRWVWGLGAPLKNPDGAVTEYVGTVVDITELRRARQEVLRTAKLESLGVLAGGIAHDFNNILTAILGNISLAQVELNDPAKAAARLADAERAADRARDLAQQLLAFARGGEPIKRTIDLTAVVQDSARFAMLGSSAACRFDLAADLWLADADKGQIGQVVHNLVLNAVQAMPKGGSVTIGTENFVSPSDGTRWVKISVADTGHGIPPEHLPNIFDPYFTTKQQGSGLGLATCHTVIKNHGGSISVESSPGTETVFHVYLPASDKVAEAALSAPDGVVHASRRVLVMDDDAAIRAVAQGMLESLGYTVDCAENGSEAVELFSKRKDEGAPFDAVILDITVPGGMGGVEAIALIRRLDPQVRAVVSSGYSAGSVMVNYQDFGFDAVLGKPYRQQEMDEMLKKLFPP